MNKEEFISYLQDPQKMSTESLVHLNNLITEFPYCQSSRILRTLYLFKEQNIRYDADLKTTAVYVNNRSLLKKHIDRLGNKKEKVESPKEELSKLLELETNQENKPEYVEEVKADSKPQDKSDIISEVRSIIERHIIDFEQSSVEEEKTTPIKINSVRSKSDLIDEFIVKQPSISRPKAEFYDPVNKAKESIVDNENIVSETLAGIFYDQGHLEKAIKIYQKLSLKFPEKSSYFAALIEKAEKELES